MFLYNILSDTQIHPVGLLCTSDQLVAEAATYRKNNKHKKRTSMPSAGFEPAIQSERIQTYVVDRTATGFCPSGIHHSKCYTAANLLTLLPRKPSIKVQLSLSTPLTHRGGTAELQLHSLLTWATVGGRCRCRCRCRLSHGCTAPRPMYTGPLCPTLE
jgi:hypothetical protein